MSKAKPKAKRPTKADRIASIEKELDARLASEKRQSCCEGHLNHVPAIKCGNGLTMSVQASEYHYCAPRDSYGPWLEVEIGFQSKRVPKLLPYAEEKKRPTKTVYGWVPLSLVAEVIESNGGFAK